ncbi:hypothetical protein EON62_02340 [archaeon]|nr:MAG: hypothetical protein EON62_02340 [archaeon]
MDIDKPIFQPLPPVVEFHGYTAFEACSAKLTFRNNDRFARRMKVIPPESPYFRIEGPVSSKGVAMVDGRVAPGTEVVYIVWFTPRDVDEYLYHLVCVTEREKFVVPLRASGKRPLLVLPDSISFPSLPVKVSSTKTFVVRNSGSKGTEFRLIPPSGFTVSPDRVYLEVDASVPVSITFRPTSVGEYAGDMTLTYSEGYTCVVDVSGAGNNVEVALDRVAVVIEPTYVTLNNQATVQLINKCVPVSPAHAHDKFSHSIRVRGCTPTRAWCPWPRCRSDTPLSFSWRQFASVADEEIERRQRLAVLDEQFDREVRGTARRVRETGWRRHAYTHSSARTRLLTMLCSARHCWRSLRRQACLWAALP